MKSASSRRRFVATVAFVTVGLAMTWALVAQRQLASSVQRETAADLDRIRAVFELARRHIRENLRAECRVLVEDPRVKSTLATEGMDEVTVTDILRDLGRLRGRGFVVVLLPNGHVFAEAGADELRGLDLSASGVVKDAQDTQDAVVGSWVIGNRVIDLAIMTVRLDSTILAYLVVAQAVDRPFLDAFADAEGVTAAILFGNGVTTSSGDTKLGPAFDAFARDPGSVHSRVIEIAGEQYVASVADMEQSGQARPRLALLRPAEAGVRTFSTVRWLLFVPPILVLVAVLLAASSRVS